MKEGLHGFIIQAHPDDRAHTGGTDVAFVAAGGRLSYVTFTDGAARFTDNAGRTLAGYPDPDELRIKRTSEDKKQISFIGGERYAGDFPDKYLSFYQDPAMDFLDTLVQKDKPDFFVVPHILDPNADHLAAAEITLAVAGDIPIYLMDTATGIDRNEDKIRHTHFIPLSRNEVRKGRKAFRLNESQTRNLPEGQIRAVFDVMGMPKRVAAELGVPGINYAAALTLVDFSLGDPLAQAFGNERIIVNRDMLLAGA